MSISKPITISPVALIALGANLPQSGTRPTATLRRALSMLDQATGLSVIAVSGWYRTPAWPRGKGPDFVNGAAILDSHLSPDALLQVLHGVESRLGRERHARWAPRSCDLDLLAQGDAVLPDDATVRRWMEMQPETDHAEAPDRLVLPHPRLHERAFVLVPLADVAPDWRHPILGLTVSEMLDALPADALAEVTPL